MQVVWARYFGAFVLALVLSQSGQHAGHDGDARGRGLQVGRSALLLLSTALNFFALRYLQLDEALSILFATPFIVAVLSGPMLGEWVGWRRWTAICVGFFGVLLVTRPGFGGMHPAALLSVGSAICYSLYSISTRILARTDSSETTLFYSNLVGALAMLPIVAVRLDDADQLARHRADGADRRLRQLRPLSPDPRSPAGAGLDAGAVHLHADGVDDDAWAFSCSVDVPHFWTIVGGLIVVASGLYLLNRERKVGTAVTAGGVTPE